MQSEAALVGSDSRVKLYSVACIHMSVALIVNPRNTELYLSLGVYKSFKKSISSELFLICINYGSDRVKYLSDSLMELGLSRVFLNYLFDYFINIRHKFILL